MTAGRLSAAVLIGQDPGAARRAAQAILSERRFRPPSFPRPLHQPLAAVGNAIRTGARAIVHGVDALGGVVPGGAPVVWALLAIMLVGLTLRAAANLSRRTLAGREPAPDELAGRQERPEVLEQDALRAEREGRLAEAVRLRFRAGLGRLAQRGAIRSATSTPTTAVSGTLRSAEFDALAARFDEIAYGGSGAQPGDVEQAREQWPVVLGSGRRR